MSPATVIPTDARPALRRVAVKRHGGAHYQRADRLGGELTLVTLCGRRPFAGWHVPRPGGPTCKTCERIAGPE